MKAQSLWQISLTTAPEAGELVGSELEAVLKQPASVYTNVDTGITTATVYLSKLPKSASRVRAELRVLCTKLREQKLLTGRNPLNITKLRAENWAESWKRHFKPIEVGKALLVKASWHRQRPAKGQCVVTLDPGLSFGTGQHATTLFCLQRLVACRDPKLQQSFLDIGTGSGILAIAAAKLGYSPVEAFDFDPDAVRTAKENAETNKVEIDLSQKDLTRLPVRAKTKYDVVCANLIYDLLCSHAHVIRERLKPGGQLIAAGILRSQFSTVCEAFAKQGLRLVKSKSLKEWQSGQFTFSK